MTAEEAEERRLISQNGWEHYTFMLSILAMDIFISDTMGQRRLCFYKSGT
jgi:hypothetical protein